MTDYQIKLINPSTDILFPFIKELNPDLSEQNFRKYLKDMIKSGFIVAGAFKKDELIGITGIWINTKFGCGKYLEIDSFIVKESYRGKRIGRKIVNFCIDLAKKNNCQSVVLNAYLENTSAHKFYGNLGFKAVGKHRILKICKLN